MQKMAKNDVWLQRRTHYERHVGHFCRYLSLFGHLATRMYAFLRNPRHRGCIMYAFLRHSRHLGCTMYAFLRHSRHLANGPQEASGGSFCAFLGRGCQIAFRKPLDAHFKHFWALAAKWLSGGIWRLILSISWPWLLNGPQEASGGSFCAFLGPYFATLLDGKLYLPVYFTILLNSKLYLPVYFTTL